MAYSEYFNYNNCEHTTLYDESYYCATTHDNYTNGCNQSYGNYSDCETTHDDYHDCATCYWNASSGWNCFMYLDCHTQTYFDWGVECHTHYDAKDHDDSHGNYSDCETTHSNYTNSCNQSYGNYQNHCNTYTDYTNHIDYSNPNSGSPIYLSWDSSWVGDEIDITYIAESVDSIKELRDKIIYLSANKSQQSADTSGLSPTNGPVDNDEFNDGNPATPEFIEDNQYDALRDNLYTLWTALTTDTFGLPVKDEEDLIRDEDFENTKKKVDELAEKDLSSAYSNHFVGYNSEIEDYSESF